MDCYNLLEFKSEFFDEFPFSGYPDDPEMTWIDFNRIIPCPETLKKDYSYTDMDLIKALYYTWDEAKNKIEKEEDISTNFMIKCIMEECYSSIMHGMRELTDGLFGKLSKSSSEMSFYHNIAYKAAKNYHKYGFVTGEGWSEKNWGCSSNATGSIVYKYKKNTKAFFITEDKVPVPVFNNLAKNFHHPFTLTFPTKDKKVFSGYGFKYVKLSSDNSEPLLTLLDEVHNKKECDELTHRFQSLYYSFDS